jgi:hypothetical protein
MEPIYDRIRKRARRIVSQYPLPGFYRDFAQATHGSRLHFRSDKMIAALRRQVTERLKDDFGHGLKHAIKVALDVGALIRIEGARAGCSEHLIRKQMTLGQCAALLHDIERQQDDHAEKGASEAEEILTSYPLSPEDITDICLAIRNHEAFQRIIPMRTRQGTILSDCLYDADKFRWGPDNFTDTLWRMVTFSRMPLSDFINHYPKGLEGLSRIRDTFRTHTGKIYGPEFIDLGLAIGNALYEIILAEFADG